MSAGLLDSARSLGANLLSLGHTRFELFSVELREEIARLSTALLGGVAAVILAALGVAFAGLAVVIATQEEHRPIAACAVSAAFIAAACGIAWRLLRAKRAKPRAFDATLAELERDYQAIKP
jgi:uncharacterized membrane protein YqjE